VGTPLNDTQVLTGVFRPNTDLVMKWIGDQLTVEGHNRASGETLSLAGTITPNAFGARPIRLATNVARTSQSLASAHCWIA
jgi:hypothetical protein